MKQRIVRMAFSITFSCVLLLTCSACSTLHHANPTGLKRPVALASQKTQCAQLGFGREASFGVCTEPACPHVTTKTRALNVPSSSSLHRKLPDDPAHIETEASLASFFDDF